MNSKLHLAARTIINKRILRILICMLFIIPLLSSSVVSSTDNWSMFHHDTLHTGYSSSSAPTTSNVLWTFSTNDNIFSSPTIVDGKLYIGSDDKKIYCLDAEDGHELWNSSVGGEVWESSPAIANDMVFIGGGNTFYCFNAENGSTIWSYQTGGSIRSSPVVVNDRVYIGSWDKKVYCLDADTSDGEDEGYDDLLEPPIVNYDLIWIFETGNLVDCSPAVYNNKVFIGSNDKKLYCLNAINGSEIWNFATGGNVFSSPTIANDKVYVGSYDYRLYCIDINTGVENWSYTTGNRVASSPAIYDGKVYVGSNDRKVYCLDALTGYAEWDSPFETGGNVFSSPAIADNKVYIGSGDNKLYCLYSNNGTKIWEYATGGSVSSSPGVYEGKVYIGSLDNKVYCFGDIPDANEAPRRPSQPIGQTDGTIDVEYTFATTTSDPQGDPIYYWFDWGDNTNSGWITSSSKSHSWSQEGTYQIKVKAKDIHGAESAWSNPSTIDIVEQTSEPEPKGWIFGSVYNDKREPIVAASVCVIISDIKQCVLTNEDGLYQVYVEAGDHTVEVKKEGYETQTKTATVIAYQALNENFILEESGDDTEPTSETRVQIDAEIEAGNIGAEIMFQREEQQISHVEVRYADITITPLEVNIENKQISLIVDGEESTGKTIVITIPETVFDMEDATIEYDGIQIKEAEGFLDVIDSRNDGSLPEYYIINEPNEIIILVSLPHFSEHTITITSILEALKGVTAIIYYIAFFAMAGVIFTAIVVVFLVKFVYSKK